MELCKKCFDWLINMREMLPGFEWGPHVHCHHEEEKTYPCVDCGKPRTKDEGGTTFTVCDECWDKRYHKKEEEPKEKCWCDYHPSIRNNYNVSVRAEGGYPNPVWTIKFCPVCGRRMI